MNRERQILNQLGLTFDSFNRSIIVQDTDEGDFLAIDVIHDSFPAEQTEKLNQLKLNPCFKSIDYINSDRFFGYEVHIKFYNNKGN